jgi:4'-phosphopantetheinyl transferase EntD
MIEEILPPQVAAVEAFGDLLDPLFPQEEALVVKAVAKRRAEFTTGRACARAALARLGLPRVPIPQGARGAPDWPDGVVGSITHCAGYRASAVARVADVLSLGVDAEPDAPLPDGVLEAIASTAERASLDQLAAQAPGVSWDRLLFSAKESVYKTWFPCTGRWLDFDEAVITINPAAGTFGARLLVSGQAHDGRPLHEFAGRWLARNGLVLTAITIAA